MKVEDLIIGVLKAVIWMIVGMVLYMIWDTHMHNAKRIDEVDQRITRLEERVYEEGKGEAIKKGAGRAPKQIEQCLAVD